MRDYYTSVTSLLEIESHHVSIRWQAGGRTGLAVVAPHAGRIEPATGELALAIAGDDHSVYCFAGRDRSNNSRVHVTSTKFTEPYLEKVLRGVTAIVAVHGCRMPMEPITMIGGSNRRLKRIFGETLIDVGFAVEQARPPMAGKHPWNVTNRARFGGVQLEISRAQRDVLLQDRGKDASVHRLECDCAFCRYVGAARKALDCYESTITF
ncbi:MAG: poly-gamma-glutamate hydrolase family protein [Nitrolancea sp.]